MSRCVACANVHSQDEIAALELKESLDSLRVRLDAAPFDSYSTGPYVGVWDTFFGYLPDDLVVEENWESLNPFGQVMEHLTSANVVALNALLVAADAAAADMGEALPAAAVEGEEKEALVAAAAVAVEGRGEEAPVVADAEAAMEGRCEEVPVVADAVAVEAFAALPLLWR